MNHPSLSEYTQRRAHTTWTGEHRGIRYNVAFWDYRDGTDPLDREPPHGTWNFYLLLPEPQWEPEVWASFLAPLHTGLTKRGRYVWQSEQSALRDLDWPGGLTFYKIEGEAPYRGITAGCDYNHLWDAEEGYPAVLDSVEYDARGCIDGLLERYTPRLRCAWTSEFGRPSEMVETARPGRFVMERVRDDVPPEWFGGTA